MSFRNLHTMIVSATMLAMAAGAPGATFTRDSPAASFTTYHNHTVTFAAWASGLSGNDRWAYTEWFIDGWRETTTPMSGQTDYVSWSKVFDIQGTYEISARGVYTDPRLVGGSEFRTQKITWTISVDSCDPYVTRVSPDYRVTVQEGAWEIFSYEARDPGGDLWRGRWFLDGVQVGVDTLFGDTTSGQRPITFETAGKYELVLRVYDVHNFTAETSWEVTVNHPPLVKHGGPYAGTLGQSVQFDGSGSTDPDGTIVSYYWEFGDGSTGTGATPSHTYTVAKTYTIALLITDNDGAIDYAETSVSIEPVSNQPPNADPGGPYGGNVGPALQFDGSGSSDSDGTIVSYAWDFGDGNSGTGVNPTHTYAAPGSYTVTLTVTDNDGASDSATTTASISQRDNEPPVADAGGPYEGTVGEPVAFASWGSSDPDGTIVSYAWDFGDGGSATGSQIESHTYTAPGTYTITLTVEDDRGGTAMDVTTATIVADSDNGTPTEPDGGTNPASSRPINLMPNPSFEVHTNGRYDPDGWGLWGTSWNAGGGNSDQEWWEACDLARTGCWLCRLRAGSGAYALADSPLIETVPDQQYYVGAWIKDLQPGGQPSATAPRFKFEFLDRQYGGSRDDGQTYAVDLPIPSDDEWHWADVALQSTSSHPWVKVLLLVENLANDGSESDYLYDDVWFGEGRPANGSGYIAIAAGDSHSLALSADGSILGWGNDSFGQASPPSGHDFVAIAANPAGFHSLALRSDGSIVGWGDDQHGQASPPTDNDFVAIAAGSRHGLALRANGRLVAWGDNSNSQLSVPTGNDFIAVGAGRYHSIALRANGSIVAWGRNTTNQSEPPAGNGFAAIAGGGFFSLALKTDGSLVGWGGKNTFGQISPPAGHDFAAVSAGVKFGLALKTDGSIVGWGDDGYGQASPPAGTSFTAVAGGGQHSLALKADGSIVAWGNNDFGQASPPQPSSSIGPTIVTGLRLTTANDVAGRDSGASELYGSKQGISGSYTLIAHGDIVDFGDAAEWPRLPDHE